MFEQMRSELQVIVSNAIKLSRKLSIRKARIETLNLQDLAAASGETGPLRFSSASDLIEAHKLHTGDLDDNIKALDGREVILLCSPPLLMSGDADGKNYGKQIVIKKGVVWMG